MLTAEAFNALLKTLEEPPSFVHLVLLTDRPSRVLPTVSSRCQAVRFDARSPQDIAAGLHGIPPDTALACARLALGDADRATMLAYGDGAALRGEAETYARAACAGAMAPPAAQALLDRAKALGAAEGAAIEAATAESLDMLPKKEQSRARREGDERARGDAGRLADRHPCPARRRRGQRHGDGPAGL